MWNDLFESDAFKQLTKFISICFLNIPIVKDIAQPNILKHYNVSKCGSAINIFIYLLKKLTNIILKHCKIFVNTAT